MLTTNISDHERWLTIAGRDIVPAVPAYTDKPNAAPVWFGDTPSIETVKGITRLSYWIERYADSEDLSDWLAQGYNLHLHHRRFKGLRFDPKRLDEVSDALGVQQFPAIRSANGQTITVVFALPPMGYTAPAVSLSGFEYLSEGSLTLCAGRDKQGRSPVTQDYPAGVMPPTVATRDLERFWRNAGGQPLTQDFEALAGRFYAAYGADPFLRQLHHGGWIRSYRVASLDVVCPFHPTALQLARYTPRIDRSGPSFKCPYPGCSHRKLRDYVAAIEEAGESGHRGGAA